MTLKSTKLAVAVAMALTLTACDSPEERAEQYFASAQELLAAGEVDKAIVELRNVFQLDPRHRDARMVFAQVLMDKGNERTAYRQLLRLVEQYPEDAEARIQLAEIAFSQRNWEELERHGAAASNLIPDDPRVEVINLGRAYYQAVTDEDLSAQQQLSAQAAQILETNDSEILRKLMVDSLAREANYPAALAQLGILLEQDPTDKTLHLQRLGILGQTQDNDAIEEQLLSMVDLFDDDPNFKSTLLRFYFSIGQTDKAEQFLRSLIDPNSEDIDAELDLVRFLAEVRGSDVAIAEINRLLEEMPDQVPLRAIRAGLTFTGGDTSTAIAEMEDILKDAEPSEQTNDIKATLAEMMLSDNNAVAARQLVGEILESDSTHSSALRMEAARKINEDDVEGAITNLRTALDQDSEDVQALSLMASAYQRNGNADLTRQYLSLATESSGFAAAESIRYARFLVSEERFLPAEGVLIPALRLDPSNVTILRELGQIYLQLEDFPRLDQVITSLRDSENTEASRVANTLEAERLNRQSGTNEALAFLERLANEEGSDTTAKLQLMQARVATGDTKGALEIAETLAAAEPENDTLAFALAAARSLNGDLTAAENDLRALIAKNPNRPQFWLELSRVVVRQGRIEEGKEVISEGLAALPDAPDLLWAKASVLERDSDFDGAIGIYEKLYERQSSNVIIANNLASLLATYREDQESLDRAFVISRRLADSEIPQLQDTYGWISFRNGDAEGALPYLENAARQLENDAVVQYHLAMVLAELGRNEEAVRQLRLALRIAGDVDARPQIALAREELARLEALASE